MELKPLSKNPKVCISISCLDEEETIGNLLDDLKAQSYKNLEVTIVDDGSTDKTVEIAKAKGAKVFINNPGRQGPAVGWNKGAKNSNAEIVGTLDADNRITDRDFVKKSVAAFDSKTIAVRTKLKSMQENWIMKAVSDPEGISLEPRFSRRDIYLQLGGFPEIGFGEDRLYAMAVDAFAQKNGLKVALADTFFSGHAVGTLYRAYKQARWYGKSGPLYLKYFNGLQYFKEWFGVYMRTVYLLSFIGLFFGLLNPLLYLLGLPFIVILLSILRKGIQNPWHLLKTITYFPAGIGLLHGWLLYATAKDKGAGS
ncbi:MAG: glycosyltransferase [Candidatus Diapherotrites archaeon]